LPRTGSNLGAPSDLDHANETINALRRENEQAKIYIEQYEN